MIVQQYALFPHLRVAENVAFGLRAHRTPRREIPARVEEALGLPGMAGYTARYPCELSGGQQQRVAIARALDIRPGVLLLDEPLSARDAQLRSGMLNELARLHRELPEVSILYVTHDQMEALTLADRIAVMDRAWLQDCRPPKASTAVPGAGSPPRSSAARTCCRSVSVPAAPRPSRAVDQQGPARGERQEAPGLPAQ